jgi:hypothetical protein
VEVSTLTGKDIGEGLQMGIHLLQVKGKVAWVVHMVEGIIVMVVVEMVEMVVVMLVARAV